MENKPEKSVMLPSPEPKLLMHPFRTLQKGYILRLALIHAKSCEGACLPIPQLNEDVPLSAVTFFSHRAGFFLSGAIVNAKEVVLHLMLF